MLSQDHLFDKTLLYVASLSARLRTLVHRVPEMLGAFRDAAHLVMRKRPTAN